MLIILFILNLFFYNINAQCRIVFATSDATVKGNVGIDGADALCQSLAALAGVPAIAQKADEFVAWISNDTVDAGARIGGLSNDCFENSNGERIATTLAEFLSPTHQNKALAYDEHAAAIQSSLYVWTGTLPLGQNNWKTSSYPHRGMAGKVSYQDGRYTADTLVDCLNSGRIACIQSPDAPPMSSEIYLHPLAQDCEDVGFVTAEIYSPLQLYSTSGADELCRKSARMSEFSIGDDWQHFRALYGQIGRTPASMLGGTKCVGSLNGRPYWMRSATTGPFTFIQTPVVNSRGQTPNSVDFWLGSSLGLDTLSSNCLYWTDSDSGQYAASVSSLNGLWFAPCNYWYSSLFCVRTSTYVGPSVSTLIEGSRLMFVTNQQYSANLPNIQGADSKCQLAAVTSQLEYVQSRSPNFRAFLSTRTMDIMSRLKALESNHSMPIVSTNGAPLFDDFDHLATTRDPLSSFWRTENGEAVYGLFEANYEYIATGSARSGRFIGTDCEQWSSTSPNVPMYAADSGDFWVSAEFTCQSQFHLVCIEMFDAVVLPTGHYAEILKESTPFPCYYMFRTSDELSLTYTLEQFDELCKARAVSSMIDAVKGQFTHFMAVMSNSTLSFKDRFLARIDTQDACFKNTQEILIISSPNTLFNGESSFQSSFLADESGNVNSATGIMVTGTREDGTSNSFTCNDWSGSGTAGLTRGVSLGVSSLGVGSACSAEHLACIQVGFTPVPTMAPTVAPSRSPTESPTAEPTESPTAEPTESPSSGAWESEQPTAMPTDQPTEMPSEMSTNANSATVTSTENGASTTTSSAAGAVSSGATSLATSTSNNAGETSTTTTVESTSTSSDNIIGGDPRGGTDLLVPIVAALLAVACLLVIAVVVVLMLRRSRRRRGAVRRGGGGGSGGDASTSADNEAGARERKQRRRTMSPRPRSPLRSPRGGATGGASSGGTAVASPSSPRKQRRRSRIVDSSSVEMSVIRQPSAPSVVSSATATTTPTTATASSQYENLPMQQPTLLNVYTDLQIRGNATADLNQVDYVNVSTQLPGDSSSYGGVPTPLSGGSGSDVYTAPPGSHEYTFVTSTSVDGAYTLAQADQLCYASALVSPKPYLASNAIQFVAFLSNHTHDAGWRIGSNMASDECFENANQESVATTLSQFLSPNHLSPAFKYNEYGNSVMSYLWTGSLPNGVASEVNCKSFTVNNHPYRGMVGETSHVDSRWASSRPAECTYTYRIGCVQSPNAPQPASEGYVYPLSAPCEGVAFVTSDTFPSTLLASTSNADEACRQSAATSEFSIGDQWQSFRALYGISDRTPESMLTGTKCVGSINGRPYFMRNSVGEPFQFIQAPLINVRGGSPTYYWAWLGSTSDLATVSDNCQDWSFTSGSAKALGTSGYNTGFSCSTTASLLCVRTTTYTGPTVESLVSSARVMFMTRQEKSSSNFGGLVSADTFCQSRAASSSLPFLSSRATNFIAYLSTKDMDLLARLYDLDEMGVDSPYVNTAGATIFAGYEHIASHVDPSATFWRDEEGEAILGVFDRTSRYLVTGTARGGRFVGTDCNGWTSSSGGLDNYVGTSSEFFASASYSCSTDTSVLCIEVPDLPTADHYSRILKLPTPFPCYYMFTTASKYSLLFPTLETADDICNTAASESTIDSVSFQASHYIAIISNSTLSFKSRYEAMFSPLNYCHKNTQERVVIEGNTLFDGKSAFLSSFYPSENGVVGSVTYVYTGSLVNGSPNYVCDDWSGTGYGSFTSGIGLGGTSGTAGCDQMGTIACIQVGYTPIPTQAPTLAPTKGSGEMSPPTRQPTNSPVEPGQPTSLPTLMPTDQPTGLPTNAPVAINSVTSDTTTTVDGVSTTTQVTLFASSTHPSSTSASTSTSSPSSSSSSDNIMGDRSTDTDMLVVIVAVILFVALLLVLAVCFVLIRRRRRRGADGVDSVATAARERKQKRRTMSPRARSPRLSPRLGATSGAGIVLPGTSSPRKHRRRSRIVDTSIELNKMSGAVPSIQRADSPPAQYEQLPVGQSATISDAAIYSGVQLSTFDPNRVEYVDVGTQMPASPAVVSAVSGGYGDLPNDPTTTDTQSICSSVAAYGALPGSSVSSESTAGVHVYAQPAVASANQPNLYAKGDIDGF